MKSLEQVRADFDSYLKNRFGFEMEDLVTVPAGVSVGERVLYLLNPNTRAARADIDQSNREIIEGMADIVADLEGLTPGVTLHIDPIMDSGLPYVRAVDLPYASELALGSLADDYAYNDDELPAPDFPVRWLFGLVFGYSAKYLLYLDFTEAKLRALFVAEYDSEFEPFTGQKVPELLRAFVSRQRDIQASASAAPDVLWVKLVQTDAGTRVKTMTRPNSHSFPDGGIS